MGHSMPDVLMHYYTKGYTFAEAAWLSIPAKPMFCYSIGDPLMNPYGLGRGPDTRIEEPDVTLEKDGKNVVVRIRMKGRADIARARVITLDKADDSRDEAQNGGKERNGPGGLFRRVKIFDFHFFLIHMNLPFPNFNCTAQPLAMPKCVIYKI